MRCNYSDCNNDSLGYIDRQLQGPFYCKDHELWAIEVVDNFYNYLLSFQEQLYKKEEQ